MNAVDATNRPEQPDEAEPASLLTIILDTNPRAWAMIADSLPLSKTIANLLVFINAHLAINHANKVAVLASHSERAEWLYPTATTTPDREADDNHNGAQNGDVQMQDPDSAGSGGPVLLPIDDANKYRPFAHVEHTLLRNLTKLLSTTTPNAISSSPATMIAGALTKALSYISKQSAALPAATQSTQFNYSDPTSVAGGNDLANPSANKSSSTSQPLTSRILILSVSGDLATQYIPIMNTIFASQRLSIPIDILKLAGDTIFLQQAADATNGIYMALDTPTAHAGFLQYLMFAYLPDASARAHLITPGEGAGVDFRAACFCHRRIVDVGYVCSVCLSIFCEPLPDGTCLTCGSHLSVGNYGLRPVVVARKKKKKRKEGRVGEESRGSTPAVG